VCRCHVELSTAEPPACTQGPSPGGAPGLALPSCCANRCPSLLPGSCARASTRDSAGPAAERQAWPVQVAVQVLHAPGSPPGRAGPPGPLPASPCGPKRGVAGIEPAASRTQSENHATRPNSHTQLTNRGGSLVIRHERRHKQAPKRAHTHKNETKQRRKHQNVQHGAKNGHTSSRTTTDRTTHKRAEDPKPSATRKAREQHRAAWNEAGDTQHARQRGKTQGRTTARPKTDSSRDPRRAHAHPNTGTQRGKRPAVSGRGREGGQACQKQRGTSTTRASAARVLPGFYPLAGRRTPSGGVAAKRPELGPKARPVGVRPAGIHGAFASSRKPPD
jgi:hypothetical protein